jgi:transposase
MLTWYNLFRQKPIIQANMPRTMLSDAQWTLLYRVMQFSNRVYNKPQHRMTLEGILYRMRTGCPWRDLPPEFGHWNTVFKRFNLWSEKGVLLCVFKWLTRLSDTEWLFLDGSIIRAHQHSSGAASAEEQAIGKSRGGNTTKIHLSVDSVGLPVHFELSGGQVHDVVHAESLVTQSPKMVCVTADKGYDSERLREHIRQQGAQPNIPRRKNAKKGNGDMDWCLYKYRHLVENAFARVKHFRAIATRYDKLHRNFASMIALAFAIMWLPMWVD